MTCRMRWGSAAALLLCLGGAAAPGAEPPFRVTVVAQGLEHPWGMAFLPDGGILVSERPGRLRLIEQGRLAPEPIAGLPPIAAEGQGGLLDVALHPRYAENGWLYLSFSARGEGGLGTEVVRGRLRGRRLTGVEPIFKVAKKSHGGRHFGSRLLFDRAGYLYITLGDRGDGARAQRLDDHAGSLVRLHDDGRIPHDNPFIGKTGARPGIFSYGHRNPQGLALHPQTGEVWSHEHGPQGGDEINLIRAGRNYGWPVITYGVNYGWGTKIGEGTHKEGMAQPLHYWNPSIAPSGMTFYSGDKFPQWRGNLFVGALKFQLLARLELDGDRVIREERLLQGELGRIRDVRQGPDGYLYLLTDEQVGRLLRLEPHP
ncbi:MAG: PQQ-dependent sugar dehydrogenase [Gammaproteobacteria bacterium]|nr:PQQ-dependent sugar dehydrogenase [Gammaproteobacteria bacterium]